MADEERGPVTRCIGENWIAVVHPRRSCEEAAKIVQGIKEKSSFRRLLLKIRGDGSMSLELS